VSMFKADGSRVMRKLARQHGHVAGQRSADHALQQAHRNCNNLQQSGPCAFNMSHMHGNQMAGVLCNNNVPPCCTNCLLA
jgi:hypothetical protein